MSGRRRQALSPTLFPFLAVLVCTLGTLILLLALVAQNTSDAAARLAEMPPDDFSVPSEDQPITGGEVQELIEEEEFRLGELVSFREAQTADLEERRDRLAHVEDHTRRIREELRAISDAMEKAHSERATESPTDEQIAALRTSLADEKERVEELRESVEGQKPRVVIVPHRGRNGTMRPPIYVECTSKGVTIHPENVSISLEQLFRTERHANPLDDALRAIRYHVMQTRGSPEPPYPLLIIRPGGEVAYRWARVAMRDWDDQFGYELVPDDLQLAYPKSDSQLRERIDYAVREATQRQIHRSLATSVARSAQRQLTERKTDFVDTFRRSAATKPSAALGLRNGSSRPSEWIP